MTDNITDTQSTQSTDTQSTDTQNDAAATDTPAPAKPKPPLPVFKQNDTVFIYRGKHRGQNGTVIVVAENDQYAVKADSGLTVMLSAGALRAPDAPSLTPDALAGILTDVNDTLGGPQKHVINKVVAAIEEDFPGFAEAYARNSAPPVAV